MSTPSSNVMLQNTTPRSYTEQAKLDSTLLRNITTKGFDPRTLDRVLKQGANPNAIRVIWQGEKEPSKDSPLIKAIDSNNEYAVQELLKVNADPFAVRHNKVPVPAIIIAIATGNENIVNALLIKEPKLINVT